MKYLTILIFAIAFLSCDRTQKSTLAELENNKVEVKKEIGIPEFTKDKSPFQSKVPRLAGKDIAFYVEHEALEEKAQHYYLGIAEASPDASFMKIFDSLSVNHNLNPFRWHLLNKAVMNADGVLAEELSQLVAKKIEVNPQGFTEMLLDTAYNGRMEVAKNYAFLLAHDIQRLEAKKNEKIEDKLIIRAMLACSTCSEKQKAVLELFFGMVDGLKD